MEAKIKQLHLLAAEIARAGHSVVVLTNIKNREQYTILGNEERLAKVITGAIDNYEVFAKSAKKPARNYTLIAMWRAAIGCIRHNKPLNE
jgi:hypothetical protein